MPDVDQGQLEQTEETVEAMPTSDKPDTEVEAQPAETEPTLPDGVSERTAKEFEKLKEHNKILAEKLKEHEVKLEQPKKSGLDDIKYNAPQFAALSQGQIDNVAQNFVDENGYVDIESLTKALNQANANALAAAAEAKRSREEIERYNHTSEVKATYKEYPELDPDNENYDETFYEMTENEIYGQLKKGKKVNFLDAANRVAKLYNPRAKKQAASEAKEQEKANANTKRVQATTTVGQNKATAQSVEHDELVERSRKGDRDAIFKRLQASGY